MVTKSSIHPSQTRAKGARGLAPETKSLLIDFVSVIEEGDASQVEAMAASFDFLALKNDRSIKLNWSLSNPLGRAAQMGRVDLTQAIAAFCDVDFRGVFGSTALMDAARCARPDTLRALLDLGASPTTTNNDKQTALLALLDDSLPHLKAERDDAAWRADVAECVDLLLPVSDLSARDRAGDTALMRAAYCVNPEPFRAIFPLCAPKMASSLQSEGRTAMSQCILRSTLDGEQARAIEMLSALESWAPLEAWNRQATASLGPKGALLELAIGASMNEVAQWLSARRLGLPESLGNAMRLILDRSLPAEFLPCARHLVAIASGSSGQDDRAGAKIPFPKALKELPERINDLRPYPRSLASLWPIADLLASSFPAASGSQKAWALANPVVMPAMAACMEARALSEAAGLTIKKGRRKAVSIGSTPKNTAAATKKRQTTRL